MFSRLYRIVSCRWLPTVLVHMYAMTTFTKTSMCRSLTFSAEVLRKNTSIRPLYILIRRSAGKVSCPTVISDTDSRGMPSRCYGRVEDFNLFSELPLLKPLLIFLFPDSKKWSKYLITVQNLSDRNQRNFNREIMLQNTYSPDLALFLSVFADAAFLGRTILSMLSRY